MEQKDKEEKAKSSDITSSMGADQSQFYRNFVNKSLDEQADEITTNLVWQQRNLLFDFDRQDRAQR